MKSLTLIKFVALLLCLSATANAQTHPDDGYWDAAFGAAAANSRVEVFFVDGNDLYVGGYFTEIGGIETCSIARWDGANWHALGPGIAEREYDGITEILVHDGIVYAGGRIYESHGVNYHDIARWDGTHWLAMGGGLQDPLFTPSVSDIVVFQGDVYVSGGFRRAGLKTVNGIARWDGSAWHDLDGGLQSILERPTASALASDGDYLYVAGRFYWDGIEDIARWDGNEWSAMPFALNGEYRDLAVAGSDLYVAGWFFSRGPGEPVNNIGRWDGIRWHSLDGGANDKVMSIFPAGGDVYIAGNFTRAGDREINRVAVWDGADWRGLGSGVDLRIWTFAVAARDNGEVFVGGDHDTAGGIPSPRIARWFNPVPYPARPAPPNGAVNQRADVLLDWDTSGAAGSPDTWDVYLGTSPDPPLVATGLTTTGFTSDTLYNDTRYYWKVVGRDLSGNHATGSVWTFRTEDLVTSRLTVSSASGRCDLTPDTVTVDIGIEDCDAQIDAAGVDIQYDPSVLTFLYCEPGELTQAWQRFDCADLGASVRVGGYDTTGIPQGSYGTFATLYFMTECCGVDSTVSYDLIPVNLTDDLAGLRAVPAAYTCEFFEPDGDINGDGYLTSGDAYCTFDSYLSYPVPLPNDCGSSGWDIRGDVDCSGDITPGDALCIYNYWRDGSCQFCGASNPTGILSAPQNPATVSIRDVRYSESTVDVVIAVSGAPALGAFGFELAFTDGPLDYVGVMRAPSLLDFEQFGTTITGTGRVRIGGFHTSALDATGETDLMTVRFHMADPSLPGTVSINQYVDDLAGASPVLTDATGAGHTSPRYDRFVLHQNHPNPFNPDTEIRYEVPEFAGRTRVSISIYDVRGKLVRRLEDRERDPGPYSVRWNGLNQAGESVSSGVYFCVLRADRAALSRKLVLLR